LAEIAIIALEKRKSDGSNRKDLLHFLNNARDPDTDQLLPDAELKAEVLSPYFHALNPSLTIE